MLPLVLVSPIRTARRLVCSVLLAFAMVALASTDAFASHFRYATVSAVPVLNAQGQPTGKMRFTITSGWRRSFFPTVVNGATTFQPEDFNFGDGTSIQPLTLTVTSFSSTEDWVIGEATIEHQYPAGNPANSPLNTWIAFGASSDRIGNLNNGANAGWRYEAVVRPWSTNSSPTSALPPIVTVPRSTAAQFFVPASDSDLDPLTGLRQRVCFRMSTNAGATPVVPPGLTINGDTGLVTWNNNTLDSVKFWFTQFIIENRDANGVVTASTPVDVLLKIIDTPSQPPTTLINGSATPVSFSVAPGSPVSFTVVSSDPDGAVPVTLGASGMPAAATTNPLLPYTATAPTTTTFTWTPTAADAGSRTITFSTTDNVGLQTSNSVNIFVESNKPPTIIGPATHTTPFTPQAPITVQVADENGDPVTVTWSVDGVPVRTDHVAATQNPTHLTYAGFGATGPHTVTVTVEDTKGATAVLTTAVTVTKAQQTISFDPIADTILGEPPFTVHATASSGLLPVVFSVLSGNASIAGNLVTLTGGGPVTIQAFQAGDGNFEPAAATQSFDVEVLDLDVTSITLETRQWIPAAVPVVPFLTDSAHAIRTFNSLPTGVPGYSPAPRTLTVFSNVSNLLTFGGVQANIGYHHHFEFNAPMDGTLAIRIGADFGGGGTLVIDGQVVEFAAHDMWWNGSYANLSQTLEGTVNITAGPHTIDSYGFEACCDGPQQAQYSYRGAPYKIFTAPANEVPAVVVTGPAAVEVGSTHDYNFTVTDPDAGATFSVVSLTCGANGALEGTPVITPHGGSFACAFSTTQGSSTVAVRVKDNRGAHSNTATLPVTIAKIAQTITFGPLADKTYGDADFGVSANASSQLAVSFAASGNCVLDIATVRLTGAGTCTITASQPGNDRYAAAPDVALTFVINRATPTVNVTAGTFTYDAQAHPATGAVTGIGGADLGGPTFTYNGVAEAPIDAGSYPVVASFAGNANYNPATNSSATIVITRAALTVTVDNESKVLGTPLPEFIASYAGFVSGEGPASLDGSLQFATAATAASPVGTYAITPVGLTSGNYAITFVPGTLNITYNVCLGYDPSKAHNSGSTIPIKLQLCGASGPVPGSPSIVVHATELFRVSNQALGEVEDAGQANPDDNFRLVGSGYMFNLQTKGLTTGVYRLVFTVTGDPESHSVLFQIR
jgi:hypothetical protein